MVKFVHTSICHLKNNLILNFDLEYDKINHTIVFFFSFCLSIIYFTAG